MWPVIQRELREQARLRSNLGLRLWGASMALAVLYWKLVTSKGAMAQDGARIFGVLNVFLVAGLWLIGPVLSADCLSQEKRAGTFNLLFLTPLKPMDIVLGKAFVHAWRAATFLTAAFPILVVPLLLGGVGWRDLLRMFLTQAAVLALALTAGLLASALSKGWLQARAMAVLISVGSACSFLAIYVTAQMLRIYLTTPAAALRDQTFFENWYGMWSHWLDRLSLFNNSYPTIWVEGAGGNTTNPKLVIMVGAVVVSFLLVVVMVVTAARHVRRVWRSPPLPPQVEAAVKSLTRDRFVMTWQKRRKGRILDFNPVWWLETARWEQRSTWALWLVVWLALIPFVNGWFDYRQYDDDLNLWALSPMIVLVVTLTSLASFHRERSEGGFELLLVTRLSVRQLVLGRFAALLFQIVPIFLVWAYLLFGHPVLGEIQAFHLLSFGLVALLVAFAASVGLFIACTRIPYIAGLLLVTLTVGLVTYGYFSLGWAEVKVRPGQTGFPLGIVAFSDEWLVPLTFAVLGLAACRIFLRLAEMALARRWFLVKPGRRAASTSRGSR